MIKAPILRLKTVKHRKVPQTLNPKSSEQPYAREADSTGPWLSKASGMVFDGGDVIIVKRV